MTHLMIAGGIWLLLLALLLVFNHACTGIDFSRRFSKPSRNGMAFLLPP